MKTSAGGQSDPANVRPRTLHSHNRTPIPLALPFLTVFRELTVFLMARELPYYSTIHPPQEATNANAVSGSSLRVPNSLEITGVHGGRSAYPCSRHRREYRNLQHRE